MCIRDMFVFFLLVVLAGTAMFPLVSHALIPDNLRKIHDESQEKREVRREQFKQNVLEKRKEVLSKWANRKQELEEKLYKERERVKSGFELRRIRNKGDKDNMEITETHEPGIAARERFLSIIKKSAQDFADFLLPFRDFRTYALELLFPS